MEYSRYFQGTQATLTQETKKVLNSSTQANPNHAKGVAKLEEQHRQGAAVQPYPVIT